MGVMWNQHKKMVTGPITFKETFCWYGYHLGVAGVGVAMGLSSGILPNQATPNGAAAILMRAAGDGKLEEKEARELLFSRLIDRDKNGILSAQEIKMARDLAERAKEVVPNHVKVFLSTLDAIELEQLKQAEIK